MNINQHNSNANAKSFELDENYRKDHINDYNFFNKCQLGKPGRAFDKDQKPEVTHATRKIRTESRKESMKDSDDSSNDDQPDEGRTELELMDDPELYESGEESTANKRRIQMKKQGFSHEDLSLERENRLAEISLKKNANPAQSYSVTHIKPDSSENPVQALVGSRRVSSKIEGVVTCDDINIKFDPLRLSQKLDLVRMNSVEIKRHVQEEPEQVEKKAQGSPLKLESDLLKAKRKPSLCQKNLNVTKTKKESKLFVDLYTKETD